MKEEYTLIKKTSPAKGEHYLLISGKQRLGKFRDLDLAKEYVREVFGLEDIEVVDDPNPAKVSNEKVKTIIRTIKDGKLISEEVTNDKEQS